MEVIQVTWTVESASDWILWDHAVSPPVPKLPKDAPVDLIEFVKANREGALAASKDRYLRVPPADMKLKMPLIPSLTQKRAKERISEVVNAWVLHRFMQHMHDPEQDRALAPIRELIGWQLSHKLDPLDYINNID
jgi:hypothetical protein